MSNVRELEETLKELLSTVEKTKQQIVAQYEQLADSLFVPPTLDESKIQNEKYLKNFLQKFFYADQWFSADFKSARELVKKPEMKGYVKKLKSHFVGGLYVNNPRFEAEWLTHPKGRTASTTNGYFLELVQVQKIDNDHKSYIFALLKEGEDHTIVDFLPSTSHGFFRVRSYSSSYHSEEFESDIEPVTFRKVTSVIFEDKHGFQ